MRNMIMFLPIVKAETDPPKSEPEASNVVNKIEEHEYRFIFNSCSVGMVSLIFCRFLKSIRPC